MSLEGCPPVGGATLIFSWRLCSCQSAHGPRATISLPKHDRAAAPSQAPVWRSVLLGTWDSCEGRGALESWQAGASAESTASSSGVFEGRLRDLGRRSWVG